MTSTEKTTGTIYLSNWVRSFAEYTGFLIPNPPITQIRAAIAKYLFNELLPANLASLNASQLLEDVLGIAAIVQIGTEKISWRAVTDQTEAEIIQLIYDSPEYSAARHFLGIDVHWLLLVNADLVEVYKQGDLYEAHMAAYDDLESRPECVIVSL